MQIKQDCHQKMSKSFPQKHDDYHRHLLQQRNRAIEIASLMKDFQTEADTQRQQSTKKNAPQMRSKNHRRTPIRKSDPHRAAYTTLLKLHPCIGSPPQIGSTFTKHSLKKHLWKAASVLIFNLEVKFCQKKLIKSKKLMRPLISCDFLTTVIVDNVCIHKLTKFPCK